ncbi:MAG: hypothetical protein NVV67_14170 [Pseudoxanthomonas sp.]|nr:hypothetical protein [Pseudoxanthomonas sp.]
MSHRILISERLRRFVRRLKKDDDVGRFIDALNGRGEAYLFGGAPRDVAFGVGRRIHDLDIFVSGSIDADEISRHSTSLSATNFGGLRLIVGKFEVDAWELDKSYAFRMGSSAHISARALLGTVCFSTDGVAVSLKTGRSIIAPEFVNSLSDRRLDFVVPPSKVEAVVGARIARLALKLGLELTPAVANYFMQCVEGMGVSSLIDAEARWGRHRMLNEIVMEQVRSDLENVVSKARESVFGVAN